MGRGTIVPDASEYLGDLRIPPNDSLDTRPAIPIAGTFDRDVLECAIRISGGAFSFDALQGKVQRFSGDCSESEVRFGLSRLIRDGLGSRGL